MLKSVLNEAGFWFYRTYDRENNPLDFMGIKRFLELFCIVVYCAGCFVGLGVIYIIYVGLITGFFIIGEANRAAKLLSTGYHKLRSKNLCR